VLCSPKAYPKGKETSVKAATCQASFALKFLSPAEMDGLEFTTGNFGGLKSETVQSEKKRAKNRSDEKTANTNISMMFQDEILFKKRLAVGPKVHFHSTLTWHWYGAIESSQANVFLSAIFCVLATKRESTNRPRCPPHILRQGGIMNKLNDESRRKSVSAAMSALQEEKPVFSENSSALEALNAEFGDADPSEWEVVVSASPDDHLIPGDVSPFLF
jgi:hypothetical protein